MSKLVVAAVVPVGVITLGIGLMQAHGVGRQVIVVQAIAMGLGVAMVLLFRRAPAAGTERALPFASLVSTALVGVTLITPGIEGVHRWLPLGPLRLHASSLLAPVTAVAVAALIASGRPARALGLAVAAQVIHVLQPDAASASALAAAVICAAGAGHAARVPRTGRDGLLLGGTVLAMVSMAVLAWRRPDPLLPLPHVEGIVELFASRGVAFHTAAIAALMLTPAAIAWPALDRQWPLAARLGAAAIAAHLAGAMIASRFGAFPVPLLGFGASPILGTYLGIGLIAAMARPPLRRG